MQGQSGQSAKCAPPTSVDPPDDKLHGVVRDSRDFGVATGVVWYKTFPGHIVATFSFLFYRISERAWLQSLAMDQRKKQLF